MQKASRIILGIDPGTLVMGYGLIAVSKNSVSLLEMGVLQLSKHDDHAERLKLIYKKIETLIKIHQPESVAIEAPFYGKNAQSMLKLGRAQGVAIASAMMHGLPTTEYAPRKIKQSITGRGNATKEQVLEMLQHTLKFDGDVRFMDATDAVAVALTHYYQEKLPKANTTLDSKLKKALGSSKKESWEHFVAANPNRVNKKKP